MTKDTYYKIQAHKAWRQEAHNHVRIRQRLIAADIRTAIMRSKTFGENDLRHLVLRNLKN